jgi:hypothetical protein
MQQTTNSAAIPAATESGLGADRRARILRRILAAGAVAGALDLAYAFTIWGFRDVPPTVILMSIASGLFGRAAFAGGVPMAALGAALHFMMTTIMAAVFARAATAMPLLARRPIVAGVGYGVGIYIVMNYVVVPLSRAASGGDQPLVMMISGIAVHMLFVGVPIALITTRGRFIWRR